MNWCRTGTSPPPSADGNGRDRCLSVLPRRPRTCSKMAEKNLDIIVSNDVLAQGAGFAVDTNVITILERGAEPARFSGTKEEAADRLLDAVAALTAKR